MAVRGGPGGRYAIPTRHKIFVGGLPDVGDAELVAYFTQFGAVADAIVMRKNGQPRGFGFVTFSSPEVYQQVLAQEHHLDGKRLALKPADGNDRGGAGAQPILRFAADPTMRPPQMHPPQMQMQPMQPLPQLPDLPQLPQLPQSQMPTLETQMQQVQQVQQMQQMQPPQQQMQPQQLQPEHGQLQPQHELQPQ